MNPDDLDIVNYQFSNYKSILNRLIIDLGSAKDNLKSKNNFVVQTPKIVREGTKKTILLNFAEICIKLQREIDHVSSYVSSELGITISIQEGGGLVLRGKFYPKGIENILVNYISEYVLCESCKSIRTSLRKNEVNKLFCLKCEDCKASRFVNPIKTGFIFQLKKKKKIKNHSFKNRLLLIESYLHISE